MQTDRIITEGPLSADAIAWRLGGKLRVTVVVKASFVYDDQGQVEMTEAPRVNAEDVWAPGGTHVVAPSDLAPFVSAPEIMFVGRTHQPEIALQVVRDGRLELVKTATLPVGIAPLSLGPLRSSWPFAPTSLDRGVVTMHRSADAACFQRAPLDQRLQALRGAEEIILTGLHPRRAQIRFAVPAPGVVAVVHRMNGDTVVSLVADGLLVDGDRQTFTMTWRGSIPVESVSELSGLRVSAYCGQHEAPIRATSAPRRGTVELAVDDDDAMRTQSLAPEALAAALRNDPVPFPTSPSSARPPESQRRPRGPASLAAQSLSGAPWSSEAARAQPTPAEGIFQTMEISTPSVKPAPSKKEVAPVSRGSVKWREDPPEPAPPPKAAAPKPKRPARRDFNAMVYGPDPRRR